MLSEMMSQGIKLQKLGRNLQARYEKAAKRPRPLIIAVGGVGSATVFGRVTRTKCRRGSTAIFGGFLSRQRQR